MLEKFQILIFIWRLFNECWALLAGEGIQTISFGPEKFFAENCAIKEWNDFKPKPISKDEKM